MFITKCHRYIVIVCSTFKTSISVFVEIRILNTVDPLKAAYYLNCHAVMSVHSNDVVASRQLTASQLSYNVAHLLKQMQILSAVFTGSQIMIPFCFREVRAMVVAVKQPSVECTAIFTMSIAHLCVLWQHTKPAWTVCETSTEKRFPTYNMSSVTNDLKR